MREFFLFHSLKITFSISYYCYCFKTWWIQATFGFYRGNECTKRDPLLMMSCRFHLILSFFSQLVHITILSLTLSICPLIVSQRKWLRNFSRVQKRSNCFQFCCNTGLTDNGTKLNRIIIIFIYLRKWALSITKRPGITSSSFFVRQPQKEIAFSRFFFLLWNFKFNPAEPVKTFYWRWKNNIGHKPDIENELITIAYIQRGLNRIFKEMSKWSDKNNELRRKIKDGTECIQKEQQSQLSQSLPHSILFNVSNPIKFST